MGLFENEGIVTSGETTKIFDVLFSARKEMGEIPKSGWNPFHKFKYSQLSDYIHTLEKILEKHKLLVVSSGVGLGENVSGGFNVAIRGRCIHVPSQEWIEVTGYGEGLDKNDYATAKSITGGRKYMLALLFNLITEDDNEATAGEKKTTKKLTAAERIKADEEARKESDEHGQQQAEAAQEFQEELDEKINIIQTIEAQEDVLRRSKITKFSIRNLKRTREGEITSAHLGEVPLEKLKQYLKWLQELEPKSAV